MTRADQLKYSADGSHSRGSKLGKARIRRYLTVNVARYSVVLLIAASSACGAAFAGPVRSPAIKAEFRRANPCPSTGRTRGACPGYQVDHREALICGGRDEVGNLQWLSIPEHKAKTRVEVKLCRPHTRH